MDFSSPLRDECEKIWLRNCASHAAEFSLGEDGGKTRGKSGINCSKFIMGFARKNLSHQKVAQRKWLANAFTHISLLALRESFKRTIKIRCNLCFFAFICDACCHKLNFKQSRLGELQPQSSRNESQGEIKSLNDSFKVCCDVLHHEARRLIYDLGRSSLRCFNCTYFQATKSARQR